MAHIKSIWFHDQNFRSGDMRVIVALRPMGELTVNVPLPEDLHSTIMKLAQTSADAHEAHMRAEILGERYVGIDVPQAHSPQAPAEEADTAQSDQGICEGVRKYGRPFPSPQADSTKEAAEISQETGNQ